MAIKHLNLEPGGRKVYALTDDRFALHPDEFDRHMFTVTHVPTMYAVVKGVTWKQALDVLALLEESDMEWSFTNPLEARKLRTGMHALLVAAGIEPWFPALPDPPP